MCLISAFFSSSFTPCLPRDFNSLSSLVTLYLEMGGDCVRFVMGFVCSYALRPFVAGGLLYTFMLAGVDLGDLLNP